MSADGCLVEYELVTFTLNDPENPKNWSHLKKWWCTSVVATTCFVVAFCSGVVTADLEGVSRDLGVSDEIALLTITVFVLGFGFGPLVFAPLSEVFGRQVVYIITLFVAVVFTIPGARAGDISTLLITRAIDGIAFSAPMVLVGGTLSDIVRNPEDSREVGSRMVADADWCRSGKLKREEYQWQHSQQRRS